MAAYNYQDIDVRFDGPILELKNGDFIEEEQTFTDSKGVEIKKWKVHKVDYLSLKCFLDYTCLLYPLQLVASNRMINPEILNIARSECKKKRSTLVRDLNVIKNRIGLYRGFLPYMALSFNNNSWLCIEKFEIDKMPETDHDKELYLEQKIEPQTKDKQSFENTRAIIANILGIYWRLRTCMAGQKITMRQYLRREGEVNPWRFSFMYRGLIPLGLATIFQSIIVQAFMQTGYQGQILLNMLWNTLGFGVAIGFFHPLYVIAARVQYSLHYPTEKLREANRGTLRAFRHIKDTYGWKGLYKGLIPQTMLTFAFFMPMYCYQAPPGFYDDE